MIKRGSKKERRSAGRKGTVLCFFTGPGGNRVDDHGIICNTHISPFALMKAIQGLFSKVNIGHSRTLM